MEKKAVVHLKKLERIFLSIGYAVRYEKGNFTAGSCLLKGEKVIVINKHFTPEGKISYLGDVLRPMLKQMEVQLADEDKVILHEIFGENY